MGFLSFLYFLFSISMFSFVLARHLLDKYEEIQQMDVEPWPEDRPYVPGPMKWYSGRTPWIKDALFSPYLKKDSNSVEKKKKKKIRNAEKY
ncbi:MAG: hypothetical protein HYZ85_04745 [Candidatus Omnitrophica bacterium]|nr:hypothetical protein [Candidatus Omnitrophota bacterium]